MKDREIGIIGGNGFVGKELVKRLRENGVDVLAPTSRETDITNRKSIDEFVKSFRGRTIVLAAGYTNVDDAETELGSAMATRLNVFGTKNVAEAAEKEGKHLIYISTDFVFPGTKNYPGPYFSYTGTATINSPSIGEYARSKILGEKIVKTTLENYVIVRISYPFGNLESEKDFIRKIIWLVEMGHPLWSDQNITITYLPDLASKITQIDYENLRGVLHVARWPRTTPYDIGEFIFQNYVTSASEVRSGSLEKFMEGRTPRPLNGGLVPSEKRVDLKDWKNAVDMTIYSHYPSKG